MAPQQPITIHNTSPFLPAFYYPTTILLPVHFSLRPMKSRPKPLPKYATFPHSPTPSHSTLHSTNSNLSAFPLTQQSSRSTSQTAFVTSTSLTESYQRSEILRYNPNIILRSQARGVRWSSKDKTATLPKPEEPNSEEEEAVVKTREFREIWDENQHLVEDREGGHVHA